MAKKIIKEKSKISKPTVNADRIVDDMVRIRNNEQAKLRRIENKLDDTTNRKQKTILRKELKQQADIVNSTKKSVVDARKQSESIHEYRENITKLKSKEASIRKRLDKLYESGSFSKEYRTLHNESVRHTGLVKAEQNKAGKLLYKLNKKVGIAPKEIIKKVKLSKSALKKTFGKDFSADFFEEKEVTETEKEFLKPGDYAVEMNKIFWKVWRDFDKNESPRLEDYTRVTFIIRGVAHSYKGTSQSEINLAATDLWDEAYELGSDTFAIKYMTLNGKKLKYDLVRPGDES